MTQLTNIATVPSELLQALRSLVQQSRQQARQDSGQMDTHVRMHDDGR